MAVAKDIHQELRRIAREASLKAYCPYSEFPVGAAVLTHTGEIFSGCNIENASYGLSMCAERVAVFQAVAHGFRRLTSIVVYTPTRKPTAPCGACRQVIHEFAPNAAVTCVCDGEESLDFEAGELLPNAFGPEDVLGDNSGRA